MPSTDSSFHFIQVLGTVPSGTVATYGQIAKLAGYPGYARQVGHTLKNLPRDTNLPWFRVVNAQGKSSFPEHTQAFRTQKKLLEAEGVVLSGVKVSLRRFGWKP